MDKQKAIRNLIDSAKMQGDTERVKRLEKQFKESGEQA